MQPSAIERLRALPGGAPSGGSGLETSEVTGDDRTSGRMSSGMTQGGGRADGLVTEHEDEDREVAQLCVQALLSPSLHSRNTRSTCSEVVPSTRRS